MERLGRLGYDQQPTPRLALLSQDVAPGTPLGPISYQTPTGVSSRGPQEPGGAPAGSQLAGPSRTGHQRGERAVARSAAGSPQDVCGWRSMFLFVDKLKELRDIRVAA